MTAFPPLQPLTARITLAHKALKEARRDGDATRILIAAKRLDNLLDRLPREQKAPVPCASDS